MQELVKMNSKGIISSREIAELTDKRHADVMRDIRNLIDQGAIGRLSFALSSYINSQNKKQPMYNLDKEASLVLATGYNAPLRAKIIKRWMELEAKEQFNIPTTYLEALEKLVETEKKKQIAEAKVKELAPKAQYFDALVDTNLLTGIRDTAKEIKLGQKQFINLLLESGYVFRNRKGNLRPYIQHVPDLMQLKDAMDKKTGRSYTQLHITPKGKETFRLLFSVTSQSTIFDFIEDE
jgi:Rha family phage regulatory protein